MTHDAKTCPGCTELAAKVEALWAYREECESLIRKGQYGGAPDWLALKTAAWAALKAAENAAPPSPQLPPGVEIVCVRDGEWDVRTRTHYLGELVRNWYERNRGNDDLGAFDTSADALSAALKAPPPPGAVQTADPGSRCPVCGERASHFVPPSLAQPGFFLCHPPIPAPPETVPPPVAETPAMKQGVCSGCGCEYAATHSAGCPVKAATAGLVPTPATGEGDGLEAEWSERRNPASGTCNPDVWTDAIAFAREQITKATAELRERIGALEREREENRKAKASKRSAKR